MALTGGRRQEGGVSGTFVPALFWGCCGLVPGFVHGLVGHGGDAFGFAFGAFDIRLGEQHAFGDVLPGDLVAVGVMDAAVDAGGAVVAAGAGQVLITRRAARRRSSGWAHHYFQTCAGGGVLKRVVGTAPRGLGGLVVVGRAVPTVLKGA